MKRTLLLARPTALLGTLVLMAISTAHANPQQQFAMQQAQAHAQHWIAMCGGPTPAYCQNNYPANTRVYKEPTIPMHYVVATIWLKTDHPKSSNMPLFYTTKYRTNAGEALAFYAVGLQHYGLAHCEKTYGKGNCFIGEYTYGRDNYVAIASPAKKGVNAASQFGWGSTQTKADNHAIAVCQSEAANWNKAAPHMAYNPNDCKVIYRKKISRVSGVGIHANQATESNPKWAEIEAEIDGQ